MDLGTVSLSLILLIALALAFDFMNGFHDAANSIATVVSTGVLKPWQAVLWAAFFNVVAVFFFHLGVAATVGKGIVDPGFVDNQLIFGALIGAIAWNLITWYYGIPSSSSHALIGGLIGAALAKAGTEPLLAPGIIKTAAFIFISPMAGMIFGASIMLAVSWMFFRQTPRRVDKWFRRLQLVSSAAYSMGHGANDAQKTMGIIWLLLIANGLTTKTPEGEFRIMDKMPAKHMGNGNLFADADDYELPGVPWTSFFTPQGHAFHGTYWHENFGTPMSHGCINMRTQEAKWLFLWASPKHEIGKTYNRGFGTLVQIHY
jgi:phosphate/sulfate permease